MNQASFHRVTAAWIDDCHEHAARPNYPAFTTASLHVTYGGGQAAVIKLYGDKPFMPQVLFGQAGSVCAFMTIDVHNVVAVRMESLTAVDGSGFRWNNILITVKDHLPERDYTVILFAEKVVTETVVIH